MELGVAIGLGVLWFLFNVIAKKQQPESGGRPRPVSLHPSTGGLGKTLDEAAGPRGRSSAGRLPRAEMVEDRTSLESTSREVVDLDDEAEKVAAQRVAAAQGDRRALRKSDHIAFDERIRREAADATAVQGANLARLRTAVIWSEILGRPVSQREPGDLP